MSSKRGRKRNDNLPPNRARDVQRAFRARRAAHLLALEQRVSELEDENAQLRKMVGWPPDDRPSLGRGPTGKDKPKADNRDSGGSHATDFFSNHGSESGSSPRTSSLSPIAIPGASHGMHAMDSDVWENAYTMPEDPSDPPPESPHHLPPIVAPVSTKPVYPSYGGGQPSSLPTSFSRSPISHPTSNTYITALAPCPHPRHLGGSYSSPSFVGRSGEMGAESPRHHFTHHASPYQDHDTDMHSQSPPPRSTTPSQLQHGASRHHRSNSSSFTHRRAVTEQYSIGSLQLPLPSQAGPQNSRPVEQHRMHDGNEHLHYNYQPHHHEQQEQQGQQHYDYRSMASYGPDQPMP